MLVEVTYLQGERVKTIHFTNNKLAKIKTNKVREREKKEKPYKQLIKLQTAYYY